MNFEHIKSKLMKVAEKCRLADLFKILLLEGALKTSETKKILINLSSQFQYFSSQGKKPLLDNQEERRIFTGLNEGVLYAIERLQEEECNVPLLEEQLKKVKFDEFEKLEEKLDFSNWLKTLNQPVLITSILLMLGLITYFCSMSSSYLIKVGERDCTPKQLANFINPILQMAFSFFAMIKANVFRRFEEDNHYYSENEENIKNRFLPIQFMNIKEWNEFKKSSNSVVRLFVKFWCVSWGAWLTLYALIFVRTLIEANLMFPFWGLETNTYIWILQDLSKNVSTFTYFLMFYALTAYITNFSEDKQNRIFREYSIYATGVALFFLIMEFIFHKEQNNIFVIRLITSMTAGVMLMLVFARLTSKIIALPIFYIVFMCFYAVLQPLYSLLDIKELINVKNTTLNIEWIPTSTLFFAFLLKAIFFLIVTWTLRTGRMLHLVAELRTWDQIKRNYYNEFVDSIPTKLD